VGSVVGAHNGHVSNDDLLFARCHYPREAQVDSEIIFRLLASVPSIADGPAYLRVVRPRLQQLDGQYTFLACDLRSPGRLLALRHTHPLSLHYQPDWRVLFFSSSYSFLRRVFGPAVAAEDLTRDQLLLFDAEGIPRLGNHPYACVDMDDGGTSDGK
jgi:glucosamine 6-phosphate synthetase-like amidotransferase/phosphosugar isomerase protein